MNPEGQTPRPETNLVTESYDTTAEVAIEPKLTSDEAIAWEASEHVHYEKDAMWLAGVIVAGLVLVVLSWLLIKSWSFALLIVVMMVAVIVMAYRPPRILRYKLDSSGVHVEEKYYNYKDFRAFGVQQEGGIYSLMLLPVKRLMPAVSIYFSAEQADQIVDVVGSRLPMEEVKPDIVDRISKKLRF